MVPLFAATALWRAYLGHRYFFFFFLSSFLSGTRFYKPSKYLALEKCPKPNPEEEKRSRLSHARTIPPEKFYVDPVLLPLESYEPSSSSSSHNLNAKKGEVQLSLSE